MSVLRTLQLYDGRRYLGEVREGVTKCEAISADGRRLGVFDSRKKAAKAVAEADDLRTLRGAS